MADTSSASTTQYGDLSAPGGIGYAYWAGRLSVAVELALGGAPADNRIARQTLAAYQTAVAAAKAWQAFEATKATS